MRHNDQLFRRPGTLNSLSLLLVVSRALKVPRPRGSTSRPTVDVENSRARAATSAQLYRRGGCVPSLGREFYFQRVSRYCVKFCAPGDNARTIVAPLAMGKCEYNEECPLHDVFPSSLYQARGERGESMESLCVHYDRENRFFLHFNINI